MQSQSFQCLRTFNDSADIEALAMSPDGSMLISGSCDNTIKIWDLRTGQLMRTLEGHKSILTCITLSPDGQTLVSSSWDTTFKIWEFHTGEVKHSCQIFDSGAEEFSIVDSLVISLDGKTLYTGTRGGSTYYWDISTGKQLRRWSISGGSLLAMSADGRTLAGTYTGTFIVSDLPEYTRRFRVETRHNSPSLAISPDRETVFIGDYDGNVYLWDARQGQELSSLGGHSGIVKAIGVSPDGKMLASGDKQGGVKVWALDSKTELCTLEGHSEDISGLIFTPDSQTLVSSSVDTSIKVWGIR
ncbi:WD40 repeat domain-containing protein [Microcoleus sp. AT3-A2]|uniref:WD40 repeat domain-containing protein n=1 Tax=unclassified Microcoleus TaxID=2642155 RepID=UPI002FD488AE